MSYFAKILALSLFFVTSPLVAGTITAELDRTEGEVGDSFQLTITIQGVAEGEPQVPQVNGLVLSQRGVSESTTITNGQRVSETQIMYAVDAQQAGAYTIPSFKANLDGKVEASLPLTLRIRGGQGQQGQAQGGQGQGTPGQGGQQPGQPGASAGGPSRAGKKVDDNGGVFIERECNQTAPYLGQQVLCAVRIFHRGNLNGGSRLSVSAPDFRRFVVDGEKRYQRVVNGQRYAVIELTEIVVPTKSGHLELPPFTIDAKVLTYSKRGRPLDQFFERFGGGVFNFDMNFTEEKSVMLKSDVTPLEVKPLPEAGKPAGFSGLVGDYQLSAALSKPSVAAGDTVTITATLSGHGLSDTLASPTLPLDQVGKVYADKPEYKEQMSAEAGIDSTRTFKLALVPSKPGSFPLGSLEIPVFNPKLGTYVTLASPLGTLEVTPGKGDQTPLVVGQGSAVPTTTMKETVKALGDELLDLHRGVALTTSQTITKKDLAAMAGVAGLPLSAAMLAFGLVQIQDRRSRRPDVQRRQKARRDFLKRRDEAQAALAANRIADAVGLCGRGLREYLGDKLNCQGTALTGREIEGHLLKLGAAEAVTQELMASVDLVDQAEFGGVLPSAERTQRLIADLTKSVDLLEVL